MDLSVSCSMNSCGTPTAGVKSIMAAKSKTTPSPGRNDRDSSKALVRDAGWLAVVS
ncbi:MAG: hypothetical protein HY068_11105 [Burkholderiales bacterium]|nr:hypothetical protein [Burkholderiales bacterium]